LGFVSGMRTSPSLCRQPRTTRPVTSGGQDEGDRVFAVQRGLRPALAKPAGVVVMMVGWPFSFLGLPVVSGRIVAIDALAEHGRIERLDLSALERAIT
jgi:hypothetical protein